MPGCAARQPFVGLLLLCWSGAALGAPVPSDRDAAGQVNIVRPFSLRHVADLDFATLAVGPTGGNATIDARSGTMTTAGGVLHVADTPVRAKWRVTTLLPTIVWIRLPSAPITLTRSGGSETMTASNFTQDGPAMRLILLPGSLEFHVGARLNVGANQAEGRYEGSFEIQVDHL